MPFDFEQDHAILSSPHFLRFISGLLFNRPLMMEQTELDFLLRMLAARLGLERPSAEGRLRTTTVERQIPGTKRATTTVVIPIHGALVNRRMGSAASGGPTTYGEIREAFKSAMNDKDVSRVLLHIDSGGGDVSGAFDTAEMIFKGRGTKPVDAFIDESGYSAAYLLASAAGRIYTPKTGGAGSIGVIAMLRNQEAADMKEGIKYQVVKFGDQKDDFNPHSAFPARAIDTIQAQVNEIGHMFVDVVARNRKVDREKIFGTKAGIFQGQSAKDMGLIDDFMSFEDAMVLEGIQQEGDGFSMAQEEQILSMLEQINTRLTTLEAGAKPETATPVVQPEAETDRNRTDYRYDIMNACLAAARLLGGAQKAQELAAELNTEGVSLAEAHSRINARLVESQSKEEIRTSISGENYGDVNPLDAAMDKMVSAMPKRAA